MIIKLIIDIGIFLFLFFLFIILNLPADICRAFMCFGPGGGLKMCSCGWMLLKTRKIFMMNNVVIDGDFIRCQVAAFENVELIQCSLSIVG